METKQVIVMRKDLNMRKGKMIAQGSHASMAFLTKGSVIQHVTIEVDRPSEKSWEELRRRLSQPEIDWLRTSFAKICVSVDSLDELLGIDKAALDAGIVSHIVTDSGLTEFSGVPTITCCAIGPDYSDKIDKITGHLKLL